MRGVPVLPGFSPGQPVFTWPVDWLLGNNSPYTGDPKITLRNIWNILQINEGKSERSQHNSVMWD